MELQELIDIGRGLALLSKEAPEADRDRLLQLRVKIAGMQLNEYGDQVDELAKQIEAPPRRLEMFAKYRVNAPTSAFHGQVGELDRIFPSDGMAALILAGQEVPVVMPSFWLEPVA